MACNHASAAVDTRDDENTPLAVVATQGSGNINTVDTTHFNTNDIFRFTNLPVELQNKIIGYAMMATDNEIRFPCLTNLSYRPNITVGLLLVNHRIYHEAHYQVRKQNTFIFSNFGSDIKSMASSIGPFKCRSGNCGHGALHSVLAKVTFDLGDEQLPSYANDTVHAFGCALRYLRSNITISSLHIRLAYHTFNNSTGLSWFATALSKIKVQDKLTIIGDETYLDMSFGDLPSNLGMDVSPVYTHLQAYNPNIQYSPGWFLHQYVPKRRVGTNADTQDTHVVVDSKYLSEIAKAFDAQHDG